MISAVGNAVGAVVATVGSGVGVSGATVGAIVVSRGTGTVVEDDVGEIVATVLGRDVGAAVLAVVGFAVVAAGAAAFSVGIRVGVRVAVGETVGVCGAGSCVGREATVTMVGGVPLVAAGEVAAGQLRDGTVVGPGERDDGTVV